MCLSEISEMLQKMLAVNVTFSRVAFAPARFHSIIIIIIIIITITTRKILWTGFSTEE